MEEVIKKDFEESIKVKQDSMHLIKDIAESASICVKALKNGNKILISGNGGSAADSQHFAAELIGKFEKHRKAIPCIALTTDSSNLTSLGNDYGYDRIFEKQIEGLGKDGDVLITISTSGTSPNIIRAAEKAKEHGMKVIGLTGKVDGDMKDKVDLLLNVNSQSVSRIQETHILILHTIAKIIENEVGIEL